jgi:hypothetical protein
MNLVDVNIDHQAKAMALGQACHDRQCLERAALCDTRVATLMIERECRVTLVSGQANGGCEDMGKTKAGTAF